MALSDTLETNKSLFENGSDTKSVRSDNIGKLEMDQLEPNFNVEKEMEALELLAQQEKADKSWFHKILSLEFELHFENKTKMVYLLGFFAAAAGLLSGLDQSLLVVPLLE